MTSEVQSTPVVQDPADKGILRTQALIVTAGPFAGRICENDDDAFLLREEFARADVRWMDAAGVVWQKPDLPEEEFDSADDHWRDVVGVDCEIVTFGFYLHCRGHYDIPRQFLRPATMKDLVQRYQEISDTLFRAAFDAKRTRSEKLVELLLEQNYIVSEIWSREAMAREGDGQKKVFLCHASDDKPFVRHVRNDLANAGHNVWIDEFEIKVGDSIVDKINAATESADALILFISKSAMKSDWVKREWNSTLNRMLSGESIRVLPVLIEDCQRPPLLSDIKYADFRTSYQTGLKDLLLALSGATGQATSRIS